VRCILLVASLLAAGCGADDDPAPTPGQPDASVAEPRAQSFVAYIHALDDGRHQAAIYFPAENRTEVLRVWEAGSEDAGIMALPRGWRPPGEVPLAHPEHALALIDRRTGVPVPYPEAARAFGEHPQLIDVVGERALAVYYTGELGPAQPLGKLVLFHGDEPTELGRVFLASGFSSNPAAYYALSPGRRCVIWSGPDGSFLADLDSGEISPRANVQVGQGEPGRSASERGAQWLPDSTGLLEQWRVADDHSEWELFDADGSGPAATGEGRIYEFAPGCEYWAVVPYEMPGPGFPDAAVPPRRIEVIPGRTPSPDGEATEGRWEIRGAEVRYSICGKHSDTESIVFRISPDGFETFTFPNHGDRRGGILSLEGDGLVMARATEPAGARVIEPSLANGSVRQSLVIMDLAGAEKLRVPLHWPSDPSWDSSGTTLVVPERAGDGWRVDLIDVASGDRRSVLEPEGYMIHLLRCDEQFLVAAQHSKDGPRVLDLFLGGPDDETWEVLATDVSYYYIGGPGTRRRWF